MGFNNGYDAGWQDAIDAVKYGKVPGLGPVSAKAADDTPATDTPATTFNAGVLEGYDVEKLLSPTDLITYLDGLTDAELIALVSNETTQVSADWASVFIPEDSARLGSILAAIKGKLYFRGLIPDAE